MVFYDAGSRARDPAAPSGGYIAVGPRFLGLPPSVRCPRSLSGPVSEYIRRRQARDDLRFSFYDIGTGARLALRRHLLYKLDGPLQLLVRRSSIALLCSTLCSRGIK